MKREGQIVIDDKIQNLAPGKSKYDLKSRVKGYWEDMTKMIWEL